MELLIFPLQLLILLLQLSLILPQRQQLSKQLGTNIKYINKWTALANLARIPGVGCAYCGLLLHAGVSTPQQLSSMTVQRLHPQLTRLQVQHPLVTISVVLLSSTVFALAGFINAIFAKKFDDISIIPTFVLTPLTYLGGVFYSISLLPEFWQTASKANPILYMVNAFRYGILGTSDIGIGHAYVILIAFVALLFSACLFLMNRGVGIRE